MKEGALKMKTIKILILCFVLLGVASLTYAASNEIVTQTISGAPGASGTWTSGLMPIQRGDGMGFINVGVSGVTPQDTSWVATVTLQRSYDDGTTYYDVYTWTSNAEHALRDFEPGIYYRIGIKSGDYTSGTINVRLSK